MERKPMFKFFKIPIISLYLVRKSETDNIEKTIQNLQDSIKILNKTCAILLGDIVDLKQELTKRTKRTY